MDKSQQVDLLGGNVLVAMQSSADTFLMLTMYRSLESVSHTPAGNLGTCMMCRSKSKDWSLVVVRDHTESGTAMYRHVIRDEMDLQGRLG
jgi:hypothetical protein